MRKTKEQKLAEVLAIVNQIRHALKKRSLSKLPKGEPNRSSLCPIGRACNLQAYEYGLWFPTYEAAEAVAAALGKRVFVGPSVSPPPLLAQFIKDFDDRKYPELIDG
jgi:hypothetical protein